MRALLYEWNSIGKQDLQDSLIRMGHHVDVIPYRFHDFFEDLAFEEKMKELLMVNSYDFFISFNFFPILSKICNEFHLRYIAWVWDSPLIFQFFNTVHLPWNYIFIFDKGLYLELKKLGVNTIYHMPLAVNVKRLDALKQKEEDCVTYNHDLSFVGSLYENRNHFDKIPYLPDYLKGYFDAMMQAQMKIHGYNIIEEMLTDDIMKEFSKYATVKESADYIGSMKALVADLFFNAKITELERKYLLELLSNKFDFTLYTDSKNVNLPKARVFGYADYYNVMPKIFRLSKINLNITLRTIRTGIPLRIFDVLGAGGFLITNYQSELKDHFELDRDIVCYESDEDLLKKIEYYLSHEKERKQIARNGYEKVKNNHTYEITLEKIINIVFPYKTCDLIDRIQKSKIIDQTKKDNKEERRIVRVAVNPKNERLEREIVNPQNETMETKDRTQKAEELKLYNEMKNQIQVLINQNQIKEAEKKFFEAYRLNEEFLFSKEGSFLEDIFDIWTYEKKLGLEPLLCVTSNLDELQDIIGYLVSLLLPIEKEIIEIGKNKKTATNENVIKTKELKERETELLLFVINNKVSYYAIEYIISKYTSNKILMFNRIAILFHQNNHETYVIPFLMKANELDEGDNDTLYNISNILLEWKENDMALEYAERIVEKSDRVDVLKNKLKAPN